MWYQQPKSKSEEREDWSQGLRSSLFSFAEFSPWCKYTGELRVSKNNIQKKFFTNLEISFKRKFHLFFDFTKKQNIISYLTITNPILNVFSDFILSNYWFLNFDFIYLVDQLLKLTENMGVKELIVVGDLCLFIRNQDYSFSKGNERAQFVEILHLPYFLELKFPRICNSLVKKLWINSQKIRHSIFGLPGIIAFQALSSKTF